MKKCGIVIPATVESKRLPHKILRNIGKQSLIEKLLCNVIQYNNYPVVLAIPNNAKNLIIEKIVTEKSIPVEIFKGHDDSPAHRMLAVAKQKGWDYVVRLTHDNPLIDISILKSQIMLAMDKDVDYCYITKMPVGTYGEVFKVSALAKAIEGRENTEYLSYLLRASEFNKLEYFPHSSFRYNARLTVDYLEDIQLLRILDHNLAPGYNLLDIINYLKRNAYLLEINKLPTISVIITNYNYSKYIVDAMASVAAQTETNWECLIFDDHSNDDSLQKITAYLTALDGVLSRKFRLLGFPQHLGLGALCNKALNFSRGKYFLRLDADDVLRNDALFLMRKAIEEATDVEGVWSGYLEFNDEDKTEKKVLPESAGYEWHPACCLLNTDTVKEVRYREVAMYEGADFLSKFRDQFKVAMVPDTLWARRFHSKQMTTDKKMCEEESEKLKQEGIDV